VPLLYTSFTVAVYTLCFSSHLPSQGLSPDPDLRDNFVKANALTSSLIAHMYLTSAKWPCTQALFLLFEGKFVYMISGLHCNQANSPNLQKCSIVMLLSIALLHFRCHSCHNRCLLGCFCPMLVGLLDLAISKASRPLSQGDANK